MRGGGSRPLRAKRFAILLCGLVAAATPVRANYREFLSVPASDELRTAVEAAASATLKEFPRLTAENLALSVIDISNADKPVRADYHGDTPFYPASAIKLFVMVETFAQHKESPEIDRALRAMIAQSDNDATAFLIDVLTDTCAGGELDASALHDFIERRRRINRDFAALGYDISAMMKPWSFGPFGREMQLLGRDKENRNRASANAFAALLYWIVQHRAVSPAASDQMLALLERPLDPPRPDENQVKEFLGEALPPGSHLWSKAGWTSEVRHDAACIALPDGRKYIVVVQTRGCAEDVRLIPQIAKYLLAELSRR